VILSLLNVRSNIAGACQYCHSVQHLALFHAAAQISWCKGLVCYGLLLSKGMYCNYEYEQKVVVWCQRKKETLKCGSQAPGASY